MSLRENLTRGLIRENPVFVLALGLCPTLAVTSSIANAVGMGLATTFVLLSSNTIVSLIRSVVPKQIRIPIYITVIATFVTIADLVMHAYQPELHKNLGIFVPLIVVNCIILGRAEAFASRNRLVPSIFDGLGMGIGFTVALVLLGAVRELLGAGQLLGYPVLPKEYEPVLIMILQPGAFLTLGLYLGLFNWIGQRRKTRRSAD
jgi:electron transport complex protein RnfE